MYSYSCETCQTKTVKMCRIDERDAQGCDDCGNALKRGLDRPGAVYAPTSTSGGLKV